MTAKHVRVGQYGETIALNHLKRRGFTLIERNYRKKWGEIDLILEKDTVIHFVEVKTVSYGTNSVRVPYETWLPEENVDRRKLQKLIRAISSWVMEHNYDGEWQIDVASVRVDLRNRRGNIKILQNIVPDV
jgi:putative endonuclease